MFALERVTQLDQPWRLVLKHHFPLALQLQSRERMNSCNVVYVGEKGTFKRLFCSIKPVLGIFFNAKTYKSMKRVKSMSEQK